MTRRRHASPRTSPAPGRAAPQVGEGGRSKLLHFGRLRGDPQPTSPAAVVLASPGRPFSEQAIRESARLARGGGVAVVTVARIHGSAFGLQHQGLFPTPRERTEQRDIVSAAIRALQRSHTDADGQVAVTRSPGKVIARVARVRGARYVVMDRPPEGRLRRLIEGDHTASVRRRLRGRAILVVVDGEAPFLQAGGQVGKAGRMRGATQRQGRGPAWR